MRIKLTLEEAARAAAEGLTIECFLLVGTKNSPEKGKRRRSMVTSDNTTYTFHGAEVPQLTAGSDLSKACETMINSIFKNNQTATRAEITAQLAKSRKWKKQRAISCIANLRKRDILVVDKL